MNPTDARLARVYQKAERAFGFIPRCYEEIAFEPRTLERHHQVWETLAEGPLSRDEVFTVLVLVAVRHENAQQLECWRRFHALRGFAGGFELYLVAPELVTPELRAVSRAVKDFFENDGRFSDDLILELFRAGKSREWLHHVLFAIGYASMNSLLSYLYEVEFDAEAQ